ncbi:MAG: tetraacyldisaccharide 4'-kinase [Pseudomonadota bacterium]
MTAIWRKLKHWSLTHLHRYLSSQWYDGSGASSSRVLQWLSALTETHVQKRPPFNVKKYRAPVIVVGNVTVGGSGKTPFVIALARLLKHHGWHPGIICRGDGASTNHSPLAVDIKAPNAPSLSEIFGDEARLHASLGFPVWQGRKRHEVALALLSHHAEVNVIISDDGLQHTALHRDIELVLLNSDWGLGNGRLIPAGPLREPPERLNTVDAIILHRTHDNAPNELLQVPGLSSWSHLTPPVFTTQLKLLQPRLLHNNQPLTLNKVAPSSDLPDSSMDWSQWAHWSKTHRLIALTAIAHPESFYRSLREKGMYLTKTLAFPDHYAFSVDDIPTHADAIFITEKDAVKCKQFDHATLWVIPSSVEIPDNLTELILQQLAKFNLGAEQADVS